MAKKPQPGKPTQTTTYPVLKAVRHDGDDYAPGEPIDLTDDQADELRRLGIIGAVPPVAPPVQGQPPEQSQA